MGIKFFCPNGHKLNVKSFLAGKRGVCPECGIGVDIPNETDARLVKNKPGAVAAVVNSAANAAAIPMSAGAVTSDGGYADDPFADIMPVVNAVRSAPPPMQAVPMAVATPISPAIPTAAAMPIGTMPTAVPQPTPIPQPIAAPAAAVPVNVAPGIPMGAAVSVAAVPVGMNPPTTAVPPPPPAAPTAPDPLLEAPHAVWYIRPTVGGQFGPARGDLMRQWLAEGRITNDSLVWREGWPEWKGAAQVFPQFGATALPEIPGAAAAAKRAVRPAKKSGSSTSVAIVIVLVVICIALFAVLAVVLSGGLQ